MVKGKEAVAVEGIAEGAAMEDSPARVGVAEAAMEAVEDSLAVAVAGEAEPKPATIAAATMPIPVQIGAVVGMVATTDSMAAATIAVINTMAALIAGMIARVTQT